MAAPKETPRLDLESYMTNYQGRLLIDRLVTIASSPSHLAPEALHLAVLQAKKGINAEEYSKLVKQLQTLAPNDPLANLDADWIAATNRRVRAETERLDTELKQYKNNLIKESIRV
jgi:COP9 signalosome complex subunit 1